VRENQSLKEHDPSSRTYSSTRSVTDDGNIFVTILGSDDSFKIPVTRPEVLGSPPAQAW
jgi:hypothetical protein